MTTGPPSLVSDATDYSHYLKFIFLLPGKEETLEKRGRCVYGPGLYCTALYSTLKCSILYYFVVYNTVLYLGAEQ